MATSTESRLSAPSDTPFTGELPAFLITIDTEGDNLWSRPRDVTTENAKFLPRFQQLCERWGLKPTYLVDYDMARCAAFVEFGRDAIRRNTAEIGMHLHPWNTPPEYKLTADDDRFHPYLIEYPESAIRDKVALMTELLGETFGVAMRSHRAGRWAFNETYAQVLIDNGYWVDCSVTPHITWQEHLGDPLGRGGADYRSFPGQSYFVDSSNIRRSGASPLLEVPMSIRPCRFDGVSRIRRRCGEHALISRVLDRFVPRYTWFRPRSNNLGEMLSVLKWVKHSRLDYIEFMLHSSEFMPGGSPTFKSEDDIERLFDTLARVFEAAMSSSFRGATLCEYYEQYREREASQ